MTDAFDTMFPRRPLMTAAEASEVVAEMAYKTSKRSAVRMLELAVSPLGNLTDEARAIYSEELARLTA